MDKKWFNIWSIVHVLWYILFALFIPNNWLFAISISILWEIYEYIMSCIFKNNDFYTEEMINRIFDIIFNLLGYYIGCVIFSLI